MMTPLRITSCAAANVSPNQAKIVFQKLVRYSSARKLADDIRAE